MIKRFKSPKKHRFVLLKVLLITLVIYLIFSIIYRALYKSYINTLSNEEIINEVIKNTKVSSFNINKYTDPTYIFKHTLNFNIIKNEPVRTLEVNNIENKESKPIVYIYTTHEGEKYTDKLLETYNIIPTVKTAEYILKDYLEDLGIETYAENRSVSSILKENNWAYNKSYDASRILIEGIIKRYPSLKLIIDLHRDSSKLDRTLLESNDKKYAKIMFVIGTENNNYKENYKLAESLNNFVESKVEGISRGIITKGGPGVNGIYNQDLSSKIILMELGGQDNEIEDLNNTLEIVAKAILELVKENEE